MNKTCLLFELLIKADRGFSGSKSRFGAPVLRRNDLANFVRLDVSQWSQIDLSHVAQEKLTSSTLQTGDILIPMFDSPETQNAPGKVDLPYGVHGWHSSDLLRVRVRESDCEPLYLYYYLKWIHRSGRAQIYYSSIENGLRRIDWGAYLNLSIPLIPRENQKELIALFSRIESIKDLLERQINQSEKAMGELFSVLFEAFLQEDEFHSEVIKLHTVVENLPSKNDSPRLADRIVTLRDVQNANWNGSPQESASVTRLYNKDHVLLGLESNHLVVVGYPNQSGLCSHNIMTILPHREKILPSYLMYLLKSDKFKRYIQQVSSSSTRRLYASTKRILEFQFLLPDRWQQDMFDAVWQNWRSLSVNLRKQILKCEEVEGIIFDKFFSNGVN